MNWKKVATNKRFWAAVIGLCVILGLVTSDVGTGILKVIMVALQAGV